MKLQTKYFGEIDCDENNIISFDEGVLGFNDDKKFIVLTDVSETEDNLFFWLQSITEPNLAFSLINIFPIIKDYEPDIDDDDLLSLEFTQEDIGLLIYNIVVIPEEIKNIRVNLKAPIVINEKTKKGKQVILKNDDYSVKHLFYSELEKLKINS